MKIFEDCVTDRVAYQFCLYYQRKRTGNKMTIQDAANIIQYIQGESAPLPKPIGAMDYSGVKVQGGGKSPPSDNRILQIIESVADADKWDSVFDEILSLYNKEEDKHVFMLAFGKKLSTDKIRKMTGVSIRTIQDRIAEVLTKTGDLAGRKNLIKIYLAQR